VDAAAGGFGADEVELVAGAVDQHDPGAPVGRVTLGGLVEHSRDDLLAGGGDRAGQPLCRGDRTLAARPTTSSVGGGVDGDDRREDVVGPAGCGVGVVDDPQGRHPLAALLLPAGQPSPVRARTLGGSGLAGGLAQRLGAHHHALAVHAEHQQRVVGGWRRRRRLVEGVDVAGGRHRELLDLPFAGDLAARSCQCLLRGAERAARRLGRRPAPQGVGVQPLGQVQGGVGGMQVARCVGPPGAAGHPHRAEHRRKVAHVVVLHLPMTGPVGVGDWAGAALSDGVPLPHRAGPGGLGTAAAAAPGRPSPGGPRAGRGPSRSPRRCRAWQQGHRRRHGSGQRRPRPRTARRRQRRRRLASGSFSSVRR